MSAESVARIEALLAILDSETKRALMAEVEAQRLRAAITEFLDAWDQSESMNEIPDAVVHLRSAHIE